MATRKKHLAEDETVKDNLSKEEKTMKKDYIREPTKRNNHTKKKTTKKNGSKEENTINNNHTREEKTINNNHTREEKTINNNHTKEEKTMHNNHTKEEKTIHNNHTREEKTIRNNHTKEEKTINNNHTGEEKTMNNNHTKEEKTIYNNHTKEEKTIRNNHTKEKKTTKKKKIIDVETQTTQILDEKKLKKLSKKAEKSFTDKQKPIQLPKKENQKVAIIIGFSYGSCPNVQYRFPAVLVDIYAAYKWAQRIGCQKIVVVTDNVAKPPTNYILNLIVDGEVGADINEFEELLEQRKQIYRFINFATFSKDAKEWLRDCHRLFLYYSGHGENSNIVLPKYNHRATYDLSANGEIFEKIKLEEFVAPLYYATEKQCRIFTIFDTCSCNSINLPFELNVTIDEVNIKDKHQLAKIPLGDNTINSGISMRNIECYDIYGGRSIYFLSSSSSLSNSIMTHIGSKFTIILFKLLQEEEDNFITLLIKLSKGVCEEQYISPTLFSSHPDVEFIQPWMRTTSHAHFYYDAVRQVVQIDGMLL